MNVTRLKPVRIEKKKAFLIKCAIVVAVLFVMFFLIFNKVRIYNSSGKMVICFKKLPKENDIICYNNGRNNKLAIFDNLRSDGTYKLFTLDKKYIITEKVTYDNYKGIVKLSIPFIFTILHSKFWLLIILIILVLLYRKNEELHSRKLNRKNKKNEIT